MPITPSPVPDAPIPAAALQPVEYDVVLTPNRDRFLGIVMEDTPGGVVIVDLVPDAAGAPSPAQKHGGIGLCDVLVRINGLPLARRNREEATRLLRAINRHGRPIALTLRSSTHSAGTWTCVVCRQSNRVVFGNRQTELLTSCAICTIGAKVVKPTP